MPKKERIAELNTQEMSLMPTSSGKKIKLGLLANYEDSEETRFLLTPEACGLLSSMGYEVLMQAKAAINISYSDEDYRCNDVKIVSREEAIKSDIVISVRPLKSRDIRKMNKESVLLCLSDTTIFEEKVVKAMIDAKITCICLDNMQSGNGIPIFAQIIDEIDGRAAVMYAQEGLSFLGDGKGVLLSGVAGITPCEVLVIGEGWRAVSAAKAALSAGAKVTLMDNDVSALYEAQQICGDRLTTSAIHPRVLFNAVKTADVIMLDNCSRNFEFPEQLSTVMKESVYIIDLTTSSPSLSVPRTVAMAISNVMVNFLNETMVKGGMTNQIASSMGVQSGVVTFKGQLVDTLIGIHLGLPCTDITMLSASIN